MGKEEGSDKSCKSLVPVKVVFMSFVTYLIAIMLYSFQRNFKNFHYGNCCFMSNVHFLRCWYVLLIQKISYIHSFPIYWLQYIRVNTSIIAHSFAKKNN